MTAYRLGELGWTQFELVCEELLTAEGLGGLGWTGRADGVRTAIADELPGALSLPAPRPGRALPGAAQRHHASPLPAIDWGDDWERAIVSRILSDLDAA